MDRHIVIILIIIFMYDISNCEPNLKPIDAKIHKVILTQKGYIQFLKYKVDVPPLSQFTFCIWLKSYNLTYTHPILSYSQHERDYLLRTDLGPGGEWLSTRVLDQELCRVRVSVPEHAWVHVCQSWDSRSARWQVYLGGELHDQGINEKLRDIKIPGGGDLVIGQHYAILEKGLDDGIEGEIFGFNMVLSSTTEPGNHKYFEKLEPKNVYTATSSDDKKLKQSEFIRFIDLKENTEMIHPKSKMSYTISETIPNDDHYFESQKFSRPFFRERELPSFPDDSINNKKIDTSRLKIVTDNYYNMDVDYAPSTHVDKSKVKEDNDHVIAIEYFPDAPEIDPDEPMIDDINNYELTDHPSAILRPPAQNYKNTFGNTKNSTENQKLELLEFLENQPLALTNLPVYQTPPSQPAYLNTNKPKESFEVQYAKENFKGNEWYDQSDYFSKEVLRHLKYGRSQRNRPKSRNHNKLMNQHRNKSYSRQQPTHKKIESDYKDLYPYPSENVEIYIKDTQDGTNFKKGNVITDHNIFRRDLSNMKRSIEILNPETVILYPRQNEIVNVEVLPRSGTPVSNDYDENQNDPKLAIISPVDNQAKDSHNYHNHKPYYSEITDNDNQGEYHFDSQHISSNIEEKIDSLKPNFEVLYSQLHYTGNQLKNKNMPKNRQENSRLSFNDSLNHYYKQYSNKKNIPTSMDLTNPNESEIFDNYDYVYMNPHGPKILTDLINFKSPKPFKFQSNLNSDGNDKLNIRSQSRQKPHINPIHYDAATDENVVVIPRQYPASLLDKINKKENVKINPYKYIFGDEENSQFRKPVKLGNVLNEIQIFRQHGNNRVTSFINSNDRIPDIHKYRSDIDESDTNTYGKDELFYNNEHLSRGKVTSFINSNDRIPDIHKYRSDIDESDTNTYGKDELFYNNEHLSRGKENAYIDYNSFRKKIQIDEDYHSKSLGRKLVELTYRKCLIDRGSPLANDDASLVNWTLTPVKIYGGAIVKSAQPICGAF